MKLARLSDKDFDRVKRDYPVSKLCPTCDDTQSYLLHDETHVCSCLDQKNLQKHYFASNIGRRYHSLSLADFDTEDAPRIRVTVEQYLTDFDSNYRYGMGLVFYGGLGTGKTLVACHILKELIKRGYSTYFIQFDDLIDTWGKRWADDDACAFLEGKLKRSEVAVIDDMKTDKRNLERFLEAGLEAVVRYRYNNSLPTIVTTNLTIDQQMVEFPRVFSLLTAVNDWIEMKNARDYRPNEYRDRLEYLRERHETLPIV